MTDSRSKEMTRLAITALEDKKAEDISIIDISEVSVLADYFLIASGSNRSQIQALTDSVEEKLAVPATARNKLKAMTPPTGYSWITAILSSTFSTVKTVFSTILKESGETEKELHGKISINPR